MDKLTHLNDEAFARYCRLEEDADSQAHRQGYDAAVLWATTGLGDPDSFEAFRRLAYYNPRVDYWNEPANNAIGLYLIMTADVANDWDDVESFWDEILGDDCVRFLDNDEFANGVVEGAVDVWEEFESKRQAA